MRAPVRARAGIVVVALGVLGLAYAGCTNDASNPEPDGVDAGTHEAGGDTGAPVKDASSAVDATTDGQAADTSAPDVSIPDGHVADTSVPDSATPDAGDAADGEVADTSIADTSVADTSIADTSIADTSVADTSVADTSIADTSVVDAPAEAAADASDAAFPTTANLLLNGDAELGTGASSALVVPVPDWTSAGNATVLIYGASGGYPVLTDPGPANRGLNFFCGGPSDGTSTLTQHVDLATYAPAIALGNVTVTLSGYLGGFSTQDDNATVTVTFLDNGSASLGTATIGPVLAADRGSVTGLLLRTTTAPVPAGTTSVDVVLTLTRLAGTANDGYADNLSMVLTGN